MILGIYAQDGTPIGELRPYSRKLVRRKCDNCGKIDWTRFEHITTCRHRHNRQLDYCHKCGTSLATAGDKNPSKKPEIRKKISKALSGKSKKFKDGKNSRILNTKKTNVGSILIYDDELKQYLHEHRMVVERCLGRKLTEKETVHHIDGDKTNNEEDNLHLFPNNRDHMKCHHQLQRIALDLVKRGIIIFDENTGKYSINPVIDLHSSKYSIGFNQVSIAQEKNICNSRLSVDISAEIIRGITRPIPLIASNMLTVTNPDFCINLYHLGALGVMHRALPAEQIEYAIKTIASECNVVCASIGVEKNDFNQAKTNIKNGANILFIDVAHGYSDAVLSLAKKIKQYSPSTKIVIGNTINPQIILESYDFVDAVKVGIGQGLACETATTAGCTEKQFSAVLKFKALATKFGIPIISDGGIRQPSDFVKAIAAGASSAMAGSIFCACPESAGQISVIDGVSKKQYSGMSSRFVQKKWRGGLKRGTCPEGKTLFLDIGENAYSLLERYGGALRSGITYAGAKDIKSFHRSVKFILTK